MMKVWPCAGTVGLEVFFHGAIIKPLYFEIMYGMKAGEYGTTTTNRYESLGREGARSAPFQLALVRPE